MNTALVDQLRRVEVAQDIQSVILTV